MPDNPMGMGHAGKEPEGKNITNESFSEAAIAMELSPEKSKENALNLLKKVLGENPTKVEKDASGFDRYDDT